MHSYLRAIGFSSLKKESEVNQLLQETFRDYTERNAVRLDKQSAFVEYTKEFADDMGITVCGEMDENGFHQEYYFPYFRGTGISTREALTVEKQGSRESYAGVCEDMRVGVSLIFYVQNTAKYKKEQILNQLVQQNINTTFSGLSIQGKILLPVRKSEEQVISGREASVKRTQMMAKARMGDEEAIESLTLEDIDLYSMVTQRLHQEDVFTIVDTFFMPYGMECDQYQIMGIINHVTTVRNPYTGEFVYQMNLECNDMTFDICINKADLTGEPAEGRRFKGVIWLQGRINFED
ncbi:MAG TPA: DUF3881 family protein [Candidatus Limivivens intestinipullorum]|uniref:DUF3881 family protein n=1 Tax=Candidatus Limivivens intestinipullorum TaxID=2840858 RepID=A0A9D1ETN9_9FIRM|nr:DUF3881 family protein [Candidatus Limivivens intestinipullorum]